MNWFSLPLGDALLASVARDAIQAEFMRAWQAAGTPDSWSLWQYTESGDLHCQQTLFFSPACADFASRQGARQAHRPAGENLEWLAGYRAMT